MTGKAAEAKHLAHGLLVLARRALLAVLSTCPVLELTLSTLHTLGGVGRKKCARTAASCSVALAFRTCRRAGVFRHFAFCATRARRLSLVGLVSADGALCANDLRSLAGKLAALAQDACLLFSRTGGLCLVAPLPCGATYARGLPRSGLVMASRACRAGGAARCCGKLTRAAIDTSDVVGRVAASAANCCDAGPVTSRASGARRATGARLGWSRRCTSTVCE